MSPNQYTKPQWYSSYQGEIHYHVGAYISGQGTPSVTCRHLLDYYNLETLNYPETFWGTLLGLVGTVRWSYQPHVVSCNQQFPDAELAAHFPDYVPARYTADYNTIEYDGEPPVLIATSSGFKSLRETTAHNQLYPVLAETEAPWWTGVASDMTKGLWFDLIFPRLNPLTIIFPRLNPLTRANIVAFLVKKRVELPTLPDVPDEPYVYYEGQQRWVLKRSPLLQPTLYFKREGGWTERTNEAALYYSEKEAETALLTLVHPLT